MEQILFKIKRRLSYFFRAKSVYHIHSPFVFLFYYNVVIRNNYKNVSNLPNRLRIYHNIQAYTSRFRIYDFSLSKASFLFEQIINNNDTILVFNCLHKNKQLFCYWNTFLNQKHNLIFLDLYYLGIVIHNDSIKQPYHFVCKI